MVQQQAALLNTLHLNTWLVDTKRPGNKRPFDLVGTFVPGQKTYGVHGRVWVELKCWSAATFGEQLGKTQDTLQDEFLKEQARDPTLQGVLVLASKVGQPTGGSWPKAALLATLWRDTEADWKTLAGKPQRVSRGQSRNKPPLQEVWDNLEWKTTAQNHKVARLSDFFGQLRLPVGNPGQRASTLNALLQQSGTTGRVYQTKLKE